MPNFVHGKGAKVLANGYDVSAYFKTASSKSSVDTAEVTAFGNTSKAYIPGVEDGTFSVDGYYDASLTGIDAQMSTILGTSTVWSIIWQGDAIGNRGYGAQTITKGVETGADIGGAVTLKAEAQNTGGTDPIVVLHALGAETSGGNGTQVDNTVATTNGAVSYLQVTAKSGTVSLVAKVQHSTDGSTWADLVTHTTVTTGNVAERIAVTGTVNRYLRALWTISGSAPSATFHLAAARL